MNKITTVALLAVILVIFGGCMSTPSAPNNYYSLQYKSGVKSTKKFNKILKVDVPHAPFNLMGKRIVYAKTPYESAHYVKNRWNESLPAMIQAWLIQSIEDAELYKAVIRSSSMVTSDLVLESDIVSFEHRLETKSVIVLIRLNLIETNNNKIIKSKLFSYEKSVESADARSAVKAFNETLKVFKKDIILWLERK